MAFTKDPREHLLNERYVFLTPIGSGGFSKVYKAYCTQNLETVAIKRMKTSLVESFDLVGEEFIPSELSILRKLQKIKYVIRIKECIESEKFFYLVFEKPKNFIDLFWYIDSRFRLEEQVARRIFRNIVVAIKLIHESGVIHRDVKDTNILVNPNSLAVKIIDFGLSSFTPVRHETKFVGTRSYAPPEWVQYRRYDPIKAECFALGWTLFVMIEGDNPFNTRNRVCSGNIEFNILSTSEPCRNLLRRLLNVNPETRPLPIDILRSDWMRSQPQ